jgi:N-acetylneuraminate synthase
MKIKYKEIGKECFIIAEAGVNHNGSLETAKKLVDAAVSAKADAVKFQTYKSEEIVTDTADMAEYQKKNIGKKESQYQMLKQLELKFEDFKELKKYCDKKGIIFLSTPHTFSAVDFLNPLVPAFKISSPDLNNTPFLEIIAQKGKPIILSTGMSTMEEIKRAVQTIENQGNKQIILLHCTTDYPCPLNDVNLKAMEKMKELGYLVGYSDHTEGILVSVMAVAMGAVVIEKHMTIDKKLTGPDHIASSEPWEFEEMVTAIRDTQKALGSEIKKPSKNEEKIKKILRKSIVAGVDIPKGDVITRDMLIIKRPGTGIPPYEIKNITGKKTKNNIKKDQLLEYNMLQ